MPVRKVGPNSYQWGTSGKVYTGKDAKAKAERQGRAIYASGYREARSAVVFQDSRGNDWVYHQGLLNLFRPYL